MNPEQNAPAWFGFILLAIYATDERSRRRVVTDGLMVNMLLPINTFQSC